MSESDAILSRCAFVCKRWEDNVGLTGNLGVRLDISNIVEKMHKTLRFFGYEI